MKNLMIVVLLLALAVPSAMARRPKDKAGSVKDNVYIDKKHSFQLTLSDDWKIKVRKNKENFRVVMLQKTYSIPPIYADAPDYTLVPRAVLWAGETSLSAFAFIDSLLSDTYKSDEKSEILREFEILESGYSEGSGSREDAVAKSRKTIKIGEDRAVLWTGQVKYMKQISTSDLSAGGKRVRGEYMGAVVAVKHDQVVLVYHLITEGQYFSAILDDLLISIKGLKWIEEEEGK